VHSPENINKNRYYSSGFTTFVANNKSK